MRHRGIGRRWVLAIPCLSLAAVPQAWGAVDIAVAKSNPVSLQAGVPATYTVVLNNLASSSGPNLTSITLVETLSPGMTYNSAASSDPAWSCPTGPTVGPATVTCTYVGPISPGASSGTLNLSLTPTLQTTMINQVDISTPGDTGVGGNNRSVTPPLSVSPSTADLSVTNLDRPDPVYAGVGLTYTSTVRNLGPGLATLVSWSDTLPPATAFAAVSWPAGWSCTAPAVGSGGTVTCTAPNLAIGANAVFTLTVAVANAAGGGLLTDTATVSSTAADPSLGNNGATATTSVSMAADCLSPFVVVPDGRLTPSLVGPGNELWFGASLRIGNAYSIEFANDTGGSTPPGTLTVFKGDDACGAPSTLTTTETSGFDPAGAGGTARQSFTAVGTLGYFRARLVNGSGLAIPFSFSWSDTTLFSPAWSTNGAFDTYYSFQNTTGADLDGTLTLLGTTGALVATFNLSIPAGQTASTNTASLLAPRSRTGTARFTHNGPPGSMVAEAAIANFIISPAYVQPVKFLAVRDAR